MVLDAEAYNDSEQPADAEVGSSGTVCRRYLTQTGP